MEAKKSNKVDLRTKSGIFFEIGMVLSLATVLAAFQWTTEEKFIGGEFDSQLNMEIEDVWLPIKTEHQKPEQKPEELAVSVIDIVEDIEKIPDIEIFNTEGNLDIPIAIIAMPEDEIDETENETFVIVEHMPVYPGGDKGLLKDIMSRVKYPEIAKQNGISGKVYVAFVVNRKGLVDKVRISRGVDPSLDQEAMRVIKTLTGWTAGKQRGKAVNVSFTVPINFKLN